MKRIIIVVEVVNREFDNAILLKCELENRGYKVKIMSKTEQISVLKADLVLIPNCYNTDNYEFYRYRFNCWTGNLISMQYEQVLSKFFVDTEFFKPKGRAQDAIHLCWGNNSYNRQLNYGVNKDKLRISGAIQLDNTRIEFNDMWKSRAEIADEYGIPKDKKWILYISSFSCAQNNLINDQLKTVFDDDRVNRFYQNSAISQQYTLKWFDNFLDEYDDYIIVYRPHPVELSSPLIDKMKKKHSEKFKCIFDLSVKQWIKVSDIITTWFSTSVVESYSIKKNCLIIRPIDLPYIDECELYYDCKAIKSYDEMKSQIREYDLSIEYFPISEATILEHYDIKEKPSYKRIADIVEQEINCEKNRERNFNIRRIAYLIKNKVFIKIIMKRMYQLLYKKFRFKITSKKLRNKFFIEEWEKNIDNSIFSKKDIQKKVVAINKIIDGKSDL